MACLFSMRVIEKKNIGTYKLFWIQIEVTIMLEISFPFYWQSNNDVFFFLLTSQG